MEPPGGGVAGHVLRGAFRARRPCGATAPAPRNYSGPLSDRPRHPGTHAALPYPAHHRVHDRRGLPARPSQEEPLQPQGVRPGLPPWGVGQHGPRPPPGRRAPGPVGTRVHRRGRRRTHPGQPAAPAGHLSRRPRVRREPPAAGKGVPGRTRMVGLRPPGARPGPRGEAARRRPGDRGAGRERAPVRSSGDRQDRVVQGAGPAARGGSPQRRGSGRRRRRAYPHREAARAPARPAPDCPGPSVAPALRRDGRPAFGRARGSGDPGRVVPRRAPGGPGPAAGPRCS